MRLNDHNDNIGRVMMARKEQEPNLKVFLFQLAFAIVLIIVAYFILEHPAWIGEHILKPIFAPIFKNFGLMPK
jgi:hypothetical protein